MATRTLLTQDEIDALTELKTVPTTLTPALQKELSDAKGDFDDAAVNTTTAVTVDALDELILSKLVGDYKARLLAAAAAAAAAAAKAATPKMVAMPAAKGPATKPGNYAAALQLYQTEPAILTQVIAAGMRRVRQENSLLQEAIPFLEGLIGRRLTYTMADVAPLADAVRRRIGLQANVGAAQKIAGLRHASVYASLLGQALWWKMKVGAIVNTMRAWSKCLADARNGPATSVSYKLVELAADEVVEWDKASPVASGDSKDLYVLLAGTADKYSEAAVDNQFAGMDLACNALIDLVDVADGKDDLDAVVKAMTDLHTALVDSFDHAGDFIDPRKARRVGKKFEILQADKATPISNAAEVIQAFYAHGRLFVKVT